MYNLNLGPVKNFAKAISSGATHRQDESDQKGAFRPWLRKAPFLETESTAMMHASAPIDYDHVQEDRVQDGQNCDPLSYRLQHQKRYVKEKRLHNRSDKLRKMHSKREGCRRNNERDPFDLSGSLTSEDASSQIQDDKSKGGHVDVVGWGSGSSQRGCSISNDDEGEKTNELVVDFGGVALSPFSALNASQTQPASSHYQPRKRHSTKSNNSIFSSVTNVSTNNSHISGGNNRNNEDCNSSSLPSHADLSQILSSLEKATLSPSPPPQKIFGTSSWDSTLSSPTSKYRQSLSVPSSPTHENLHISSAPPLLPILPHDQHHNQRQHPSPITRSLPPSLQPQNQGDEEEDPRLAQLKQQTTDELRTELSKIQAQSKSNLENSWAEIERMRVENSELDDQLAEVSRKLAASRAAMLSINSTDSDSRNNIVSPSDTFNLGGNISLRRKSQQKIIQRSASVKNLSDFPQETELHSSLGTSNVFRSSTMMNSKGSTGKSHYNKINCSADATNVLLGNAFDAEEVADSISCSGKPNRGFFVDLGKSFCDVKSSDGSVDSSDSEVSFGIDIGENRSSSATNFVGTCEKEELDDQIPNSLISTSSTAPQSRPLSKSSTMGNGKYTNSHSSLDDDCISDDNISDGKSGVFYPPPGEDEDGKYCNSRQQLVESPSIDCSEMDDFDFDPLSESTHVNTDQGSSKSANGKTKERSGFTRRPSFMSLFEEKYVQDDDEDSIVSLSKKSQQKEDRASLVKEMILAKDIEIEKLIKLIRAQVEDMRTCEMEILRANIKCGEDEKQLKTQDSILQKQIEELEQANSEIESKLDSAGRSEQKAKEKESALKEKLENLQEEECGFDLEKQLSCHQQQYNTSQENAISSLSGLLNDFDAMHIPSLRGELEDNIIALFDDLTNKEEELIMLLSDSGRLTSCQASFQQIQKHIETAMGRQNQLGQLEADLHSYLDTITMLIKQDEEGTHTTESSTASERLSLERVFVEAILLHLSSVKQKQGKLILDALFNSVEFLTNWDQWLLPDFASSPPPSRLSNGDLGTGVSTITMLKGVVKKASAELAAVKSDVLNEQAKFQAKMKIVDSCNTNNTTDGSGLNHDDSEERHTGEIEGYELNRKVSRQISVVETILAARESLMDKYASSFCPMQAQAREAKPNFQLLDNIFEEDTEREQLEELDEEISNTTNILLEKESLRNKYSSQLDLMQAQASEDSKANLQLLNKIQMKISHIVVKLADEESLIASLKTLLWTKKENFGALESQQK